jgi:dihydroorotate dehydrogenase electron transfer subunit
MPMAQQRQLALIDQRAATPRLCWLTLAAPELAHNVRAGQYLLVRCAEVGSYDPLLRRALFVAAAEPALGQIGLLYEPNERGLAWLARGRPGDLIDIVGPLGQPFAVHERTRNLLLIGEGPGLPALLLLARESVARGRAVTLLVGAADDSALPPPYLLPGEVEYQSIIGPAVDLLAGATAATRETRGQEDKKTKGQDHVSLSLVLPLSVSPLAWADQVCVALPGDQLPALRDAIRAIKYRWERGFASALLEGPIVCGVGACGVCAVELRKRTRMLCSDGPVFDLRDVVSNV